MMGLRSHSFYFIYMTQDNINLNLNTPSTSSGPQVVRQYNYWRPIEEEFIRLYLENNESVSLQEMETLLGELEPPAHGPPLPHRTTKGIRNKISRLGLDHVFLAKNPNSRSNRSSQSMSIELTSTQRAESVVDEPSIQEETGSSSYMDYDDIFVLVENEVSTTSINTGLELESDLGPPNELEVFKENLMKRIPKYMTIHGGNKWRKPLRRFRIQNKYWPAIDNVLKEIIELRNTNDLSEINDIIYCLGLAVNEVLITKSRIDSDHQDWMRTHNKIMRKLRKHLSWANELKETPKYRLSKKGLKPKWWNIYRNVICKYDRSPVAAAGLIHHKILTLKRVESIRIKKYDAYKKHKAVGKNILHSEKMADSIEAETIKSYWHGIVGNSYDLNLTEKFVEWSQTINISSDEPYIWLEEKINPWLDVVIKKAKPWKAPGPDGIQAYWLKRLPTVKPFILKKIKDLLSGQKPDDWLCMGRVVSIPKKENANSPDQFRPITCTNSMYKLVTGVLCEYLKCYCDKWELIPKEQRAIRSGNWACTEAHIVDNTIRDKVKYDGQRVGLAWFDYAKAYDSISHDYLIFVLQKLGFPSQVYKCIMNIMQTWSVRYIGKGNEISDPLRIKRGILQGDTMSPYLFCIGLIPITFIINTEFPAIEISKRFQDPINISHAFYMDDLVVYYQTNRKSDVIKTVDEASRVAGLLLNFTKCATLDVSGSNNSDIPDIGILGTYKYLGIKVGRNTNLKSSLEPCFERVKAIVTRIIKSNASSWQMTLLYNSQVIPIYSFIFLNAINCDGKLVSTIAIGKRLDKILIDLLRECQLLQKSGNSKRVFVSPKNGGLGFKSATDEIALCIIRKYIYLKFHSRFEGIVDCLTRYYNRQKRNAISDFCNLVNYFKFEKIVVNAGEIIVGDLIFDKIKLAMKTIKNDILKNTEKDRLKSIQDKPMGSRWMTWNINIEMSFGYLRTHLNSKSVFNAFAIQEGAIITRNHPGSNNSNTICRICKSSDETIQHVLVGCKVIRGTRMVRRHNEVCLHVLNYIRKIMGLNAVHYSEQITRFVRYGDSEYFYDFNMIPHIKHNRPDIIFRSGQKIYIIEIAISWPLGENHSIDKQIEWKYFKYAINSELDYHEWEDNREARGNSLVNELSLLWRTTDIEVIPIVIGTCGELTDAAIANIRRLPGNLHDKLITNIQRSVVINSDFIMRAHLAVN